MPLCRLCYGISCEVLTIALTVDFAIGLAIELTIVLIIMPIAYLPR